MKPLYFVSLAALLVVILIQSVLAYPTGAVETHYSFDDNMTGGGYAYDSTGLFNATNNGATTGVTGKIGQAYTFDGVNDYMTAGMIVNDNKTVCFWVNSTTAATGDSIIQGAGGYTVLGTGNEVGWGCTIFANDRITLTSYQGSYNNKCAGSTTPYTSGTWTHYCAVWNKTGDNNKIYANGVLEYTSTDGGIDSNSETQRFGGITGRFFAGSIDEMTIFNDAKSEDDIARIYANESAGCAYPWNCTTAPGTTPPPTWVAPTPTDGTRNNTQVTLNASCGTNTTFIYFDTSATPTTLVLTNSTTGAWLTNVTTSGTYYFKAGCWNSSTGYSSNTTVRSWIYDIVAPNIVLNANNEFNSANFSLRDQYDNGLNLSINFTDNLALYAFEINITNASGATMWNYTASNLTGTTYWYNASIDVTSWPAGRYSVYLAVSDAHTAAAITDYQVTKKKSSVTFKTPNENNIKVETRSASTITATKLVDRYTFRMVFDDGLTASRVFDVKTDRCPLTYLPNSGFKAHFVSLCDVGEGGNWVDFEGVDGKPTVTRYNDFHYSVSFASVPSTVEFQSIGGLNIINTTYSWYRGVYTVGSAYAVKGDPFTMSLNLSSDATQLLNVSFLYNGTARNLTFTNGTTWMYWETSILMTVNGTFSYNWTVNNTQGDANFTQFNLSGSHTVNEWLLDDCTSFTSRRIRWNLYEENVPGLALTGTMQVYATYYPTTANNSKTLNLSYASASFFEICASPANLTFYMDIYAQFVYPGTFTHRFYVQNGTFVGNTWTNYSIYNLNSTGNVSFLKVTARNVADYSYFLNVLAYLQRRYVGEGVWRTVQMDKSGDYGLLLFDIYEKSTDYRILYYDENNTLLYETQPMKFSCTAYLCDLTQLLNPASASSVGSGTTTLASYDNATKVLTLSWSESVLNTTTMNVTVKKLTMTGENTVCNAVQTGVAGSYACNLTSYSGQMFVTMDAAGETLRAEWLDIPSPRLSDYMDASEQSFWSFGIFVTIAMAGLFSPVGALIAGVVGLVVLFFLGILSPLTITGIIIVGAVASLIGVKVRT
jgi:hypothetical protein